MKWYDHTLILLVFWTIYWSVSLVLWYETRLRYQVDLRYILMTGVVLALSYITGNTIYTLVTQSVSWSLRLIRWKYRLRRLLPWRRRRKRRSTYLEVPGNEEEVKDTVSPNHDVHVELPLPPSPIHQPKKQIMKVIRDVN
jgi:hypothetical protein